MNFTQKSVVSIVLLSYFITAIDGSIVITGIAKITSDLNLPNHLVSWIQNPNFAVFYISRETAIW